MDLNEIARTIKQIKKSLFKKSSRHSLGLMKSHLKGIGMQFKEHKVYVHGDDLRFIDWKVLAKTHSPYIKTFEQERNIEILIFIDASLSMLLGYKGISKLQAALDIAFSLYFLSAETKDKVHTVLLGEKVVDVPRSSGEKGLVTFVGLLKRHKIIDDDGKVLKSYVPEKDFSMEEKYQALMKVGIKRKEILLLSDFYHFLSREALDRLIARGNFYPVQILSPLDEMRKFPFGSFGKRAEASSSQRGGVFWSPDSPTLLTSSPKPAGQGKVRRRKTVIELNVNRNYLDDFVDGMTL